MSSKLRNLFIIYSALVRVDSRYAKIHVKDADRGKWRLVVCEPRTFARTEKKLDNIPHPRTSMGIDSSNYQTCFTRRAKAIKLHAFVRI